MGIVSRMARPRALGSWGPEDDRWYTPGGAFYGGYIPTAAGVPVDSDSAMRLMTVHNCVKVLSQSVAQLPLHLMEQNGKLKEKALTHRLYRRLHDQPNSWMTASEFWGMAVAHVSLRGNFYAYKLGMPGGPVKELIPFKADRVEEVKQAEDYSLIYTVRLPTGERVEIPQTRMLHLRGLVLNGLTGMNPIECAREAVGLGLANAEFLARYYGKGMHPGAVIMHPMTLNTPAHANLRKVLTEKYAGLGKSHELMLIDEGMKIEFPKMTLVDAQFLEQGKFNQSQICGMFRVPLMLVQAGDAPTTYASAEQFMLAFVTHALTPLVVNIEQAIKRDLLTPEEQGRYYAKFSMAGLLRGDMEARFTAYQIGVNTEILNPNEVRDLEDLNPYPGGEVYRTRTSTVKETPAAKPGALRAGFHPGAGSTPDGGTNGNHDEAIRREAAR